MEIKRNPRDTAEYNFDLAIPIDRDKITMSNTSCFGRIWDITTPACGRCADRDTCGIIYQDTLDKKANVIEKKTGSYFLDRADFANVTDRKLRKFIRSGETTVKELLEFVSTAATCSDSKALVNFIKTWVKKNNDISTKGGIIWVK